MSKILPDNRIIWIIAILAAILIPVFGKFREGSDAPWNIKAIARIYLVGFHYKQKWSKRLAEI
jgi:hypothetical protein